MFSELHMEICVYVPIEVQKKNSGRQGQDLTFEMEPFPTLGPCPP